MRTRLLRGLVAAGTLILTGCYIGALDGGMRQHRDFHYTFPLQNGGRVSVESFNGAVEISGWDENTVQIDGSKWGPTSEAADALRIDIDHTPEAVSVHVVRPVDWRGSVGARFTLKVPRRAMLDRIVTTNGSIRAEDTAGPAHLRTTNESIRVERMHGAVEAQTTNGSVNLTRVDGDVNLRTTNGRLHAVDLTGGVDAITTNGSIDLELSASPARDVTAHTTNGGITVRMPGSSGARVLAHTTNSSIRCDFDLKTDGEPRRQRLEGVIGNSGPLIELTTTNGSIRLEKM